MMDSYRFSISCLNVVLLYFIIIVVVVLFVFHLIISIKNITYSNLILFIFDQIEPISTDFNYEYSWPSYTNYIVRYV